MNRKIANPLGHVAHAILVLLSLAAVMPFVLLIISSFTDDRTLIKNGYSFFPEKLSIAAYDYLWIQKNMILRAYGMTILMAVIGTAVSLTITSLLAYSLSRNDNPLKNKLTFVVFFTMLFNGGLVPTYLLYTHYLGVKNTLFGLLIPGLLMNGFNVLIMRTFFKTNIPDAIIESAMIDGAGKFKTFITIALPLSYPILATIGLLVGIAYWNDWYNGLIYITDPKLYNIQNMLNRILMNVQFLATQNIGSSMGELLSNLPTVSIRMAIAFVGVVPILGAYPFFQRYFVKGITIGAVKG